MPDVKVWSSLTSVEHAVILSALGLALASAVRLSNRANAPKLVTDSYRTEAEKLRVLIAKVS
ncbi:MAG: hypothetical protein [Microvirus sp.]|nr:MAG: hypothetical protein [Microvirus sp.]